MLPRIQQNIERLKANLISDQSDLDLMQKEIDTHRSCLLEQFKEPVLDNAQINLRLILQELAQRRKTLEYKKARFNKFKLISFAISFLLVFAAALTFTILVPQLAMPVILMLYVAMIVTRCVPAHYNIFHHMLDWVRKCTEAPFENIIDNETSEYNLLSEKARLLEQRISIIKTNTNLLGVIEESIANTTKQIQEYEERQRKRASSGGSATPKPKKGSSNQARLFRELSTSSELNSMLSENSSTVATPTQPTQQQQFTTSKFL